jgi:fumarate reductase subunit C
MSMPTSSEPPSVLRGPTSGPSGWTGWVAFAAAMMVVVGILSVIAGFGALLRDQSYFTANGRLLVFDYTAWGWIHLVIGVLLMIVGVALYSGSTVARIAAVVVVGLNLIAQFTWIDSAPWWSLTMIAIDVLVIFALVVHGGELRNADRRYD